MDTSSPRDGSRPSSTRGVYSISVAAELVGTGVQNLRLYEARGLLTPDRTSGGTRRYSDDDIARLRRISALLDAGLNLAGIEAVLQLEDANVTLQEANSALQDENVALRDAHDREAGPRAP
ncbi:MerR family transcriptional regulator [Oryzobacter terrae]|uniref:MerR family transcriptional regulator n=1 Tax=Oryzobacter terrae TaxID=1620385 RepID=UPI0036712AE7